VLENDIARFVLREIHEHARTELQLYVGWFTFFLTLLLGSMGWSLRASLDSRGKVVAPFPFYCMVFLFSLQLVFSIVATRAVAGDLQDADDRGRTLQMQIWQAQSVSKQASIPTALQLPNPYPQGIHRAMTLMEWTLTTNLVFWLFVAVLVARNKGRKLAAAVD
jgi:hypothetical protein